MTIGGEGPSVQKPIINYSTEIGWNYIPPEEALRFRGGETGFIFKELFINQIQRLNHAFMDNLLAEELIKSIERIPPNIEGNLIAWEYLKGLKTVFVPNQKRELDVRFIDTDNINKNSFHVTDEFSFTNGNKAIRPDIVFLINGVPVLLIETKASHKMEAISEALEQVKRYHRETPELMAIFQIYALTHLIKYYYSSTWNFSHKSLFNWREELGQEPSNDGFERLVKSFLDRERVIKLVTDYILFTRQDDELKKVILRPHQTRAVEKIIERTADKAKRRGLIWHTQGSGKTYTMIVAAKKIMENPLFENPTVLMLVDRTELETQLFGNLTAVGFENVEIADSKRELRELLQQDRRGLIVSMIHKFDDIPKDINTRENIFVLVDEAHRTTGGDLGNYLMGALPNATYIGFTGTPIDRTNYGQGTFVTFGKDDPPHGYLDKYNIAESIEDGTTVPLHYTLAPNELRVDRAILDKEFLDLKDAEGVSDIEELNKVLERAVNLRNMLKNRERVEKVAKYASDHFTNYIEPMGYKAFFVAVDREACTFYKKELDKHLPPAYSEVVMSSGFNDPEDMARFHITEAQEKKIRKSFRNPNELPKILIVTEKLLTGFDAPILYCMYLDKPMRDHVLLQAIARVNRPYEDDEGRKKPSGFILDFVGIFENLEKALAFDSTDIEGVVHDLNVLKVRFTDLMKRAREDYLKLIEGKGKDKAVESLLQHFMEEDIRQEYYRFFKETSTIYEILSPDAFLSSYIKDYETLARIYRILKEAYEPSIPVDKEFLRKTARLVQEHTHSGMVKEAIEVYEINEDTLKKIEESHASDTEKVFNLLKSIQKEIEKYRDTSPYLISIGEKAENIAKLFVERQKHTQETLEEFKKLIQEINEARREQAEKNIPVEAFSIFWMLKKEGVEKPEDKANQMNTVLNKFPHWKTSERQESSVKQELYKILVQSKVSNITELAKGIIRVIKGQS
jgi:type I restriction enzyme R subunit